MKKIHFVGVFVAIVLLIMSIMYFISNPTPTTPNDPNYIPPDEEVWIVVEYGPDGPIDANGNFVRDSS